MRDLPENNQESLPSSPRGDWNLDIVGASSEVVVRFTGTWTWDSDIPSTSLILKSVQRRIAGIKLSKITIDCANIVRWDSTLVAILYLFSKEYGSKLNLLALPKSVVEILGLAERRSTRADPGRRTTEVSILTAISLKFRKIIEEVEAFLALTGEILLAILAVARGRARFRWRDFWFLLYECGPRAVGLVTLISLLVGLILAFVASVQLREFGAQLYVANLVVLAMTREMGAIMASLIMAGRTGSSYAAQLGTMEVNEEIDALKTFGISPVAFLVLPRLAALTVALPFLCVYADLLGVVGGMIIGTGLFDISPTLYLSQTILSVRTQDILFGIGKSIIFAILVAFAGCLRGLGCGRSSIAVGEATTSAVVSSIILIIVVDALFAVAANVLGI